MVKILKFCGKELTIDYILSAISAHRDVDMSQNIEYFIGVSFELAEPEFGHY